jgi:hypothetical protein
MMVHAYVQIMRYLFYHPLTVMPVNMMVMLTLAALFGYLVAWFLTNRPK